MNLAFSQHVTAPDSVLVRELDGETVILDLESESYFGLDEVGTRMWALLTTSASIQEAFDGLLDEYDVKADQLRADLTDFITQLVDQGLLVVDHADVS